MLLCKCVGGVREQLISEQRSALREGGGVLSCSLSLGLRERDLDVECEEIGRFEGIASKLFGGCCLQ